MTQTVTASALPLSLSRKASDRTASSRLLFALNRNLGTAELTEPPAPPRRMDGVSACFGVIATQAYAVANDDDWRHNGKHIGSAKQLSRTQAAHIARCADFMTRGFVPLSNCAAAVRALTQALNSCVRPHYDNFINLRSCATPKTPETVGYVQFTHAFSAPVVLHKHCDNLVLQPVINLTDSSSHSVAGKQIATQHSPHVQAAIPVPCRYYPAPEPPPPKPVRVCRPRPPSSRLPLPLYRRKTHLPSYALPLPLACWHTRLPQTIPSLRSYIVHNNISATVGGIAVRPITFDIQTDMQSYCWQGSIGIGAADFERIKHKLDAQRGSEPTMVVNVNGFAFSLVFEEYSRSRAFAQATHRLSGRSITARLGADYAQANAGLVTQASYASQIVNAQLANLPFTAGFGIADWLIPAGAYAVTGKTPIAVISDIAAAAGGFLTSHASQPLLLIRPRYKIPAWSVATAEPDATIPMGVVRRIDDSRRTNPRYNTVTLTSDSQGGIVHRRLEARDRDAPAQNNPLYTDQAVIIPAGTAILSDSGTHVAYTLTMRWSDKYNTPLGELGQIWQINDAEGYFRGVVTGVSLSVRLENKAPTVWQTVNIDRYADV